MARAIIFDLDNTLIDFVETKNFVIQESVKAMMSDACNIVGVEK